eukprot:maker-scaffold_3-snap-gene-6.47-mRNA-1 protein AED:0.12 eAED:0.12 QI:233/1/1/1/0.5/0.33/3/554/302
MALLLLPYNIMYENKLGNIHTAVDRFSLLEPKCIIVSNPSEYISVITLNRPERRNALNHHLRYQIFHQLAINDQDPNIRMTIIKGSGSCFCAGYDLNMKPEDVFANIESPGIGKFQRSVVQGWFSIMDLAKPVIAQVHGHCLAGGMELASACDIVFVSKDAKIGYPPVRSMGLPDFQVLPYLIGYKRAMQFMLTGDSMTGEQAENFGFANFSVDVNDLETECLKFAERVAKIPSELQQFNKRSVQRAMENMGMRNYLRQAIDLQIVSHSSPTAQGFMQKFSQGNIAKAFKERDAKFNEKSKL